MTDVLPGIRARRKTAGLTLIELAAQIGVTHQAIGAWERGEALPGADRLPALAAALGCSIDELYEGGPDQRGVEDAAPYTQDHFTQEG